MEKDIDKEINKTRTSFEERFKNLDFYEKQTRDDEHLTKILKNLDIVDQMRILDVGTGKGYLIFPIANNNSTLSCTGIDIIESVIEADNKRAQLEGLKNLNFVCYNGYNFPFEENEFDLIVSRYAIHHFVDINDAFFAFWKLLKPNRKLFISDPTPTDEDNENFINDYMRLFNDGHNKYYTLEEFDKIAKDNNFSIVDNFKTSISFPKELNKVDNFDRFLAKYSGPVRRSYNIKVANGNIFMSQPVNNITFIKR